MLSGPRTAVIIGAGPAGLTAAWELSQRTGLHPIVLEMSSQLGGLSRTVVHNGNRIDIGGHRFFTKVDRVMDWWLDMMPLQQLDEDVTLTYHNRTRPLPARTGPAPGKDEQAVMLVRPRRSRIYYQGQFFDYPLKLTPETLGKLGLRQTARIAASYGRAMLRPRPEHSLEDFLINRFGRVLYETFFEEYTEKVWGVPCAEISAEWGAQRIKGLNLKTALEHFLRRLLPGSPVDIAQKDTETSLIEQFLYPRLGPGQMWETVAERVLAAGGEIRTGWKVIEVIAAPDSQQVTGVVARSPSGERVTIEADVVISTMPVQELVRALAPTAPAPPAVRAISEGLVYRDFITVGVLADRLRLHDVVDGRQVPIRDNWLYIPEPGVHVGRMQIFNNWSPDLVADPSQAWIGLEYFCTRGDALWS
ncbi:MAG: protoporphyrinogen oxidase, partial [Myxococcota bacterium]